MTGLIGVIALLATAPGPSGSGLRRGVIFFALIAALLAGFVFIVALITALRRRARREARCRLPRTPMRTDPWKESAERLNLPEQH